MNYQESTTSIGEEDPITSDLKDGTFTPSLTRDSVITYTTDLEDSSIFSSETDLDHEFVEKPVRRSSTIRKDFTPFYRKRRFWAICTAVSVVLSAIFIPLLFLVIIPNVARSSINKSTMTFDAINITNPTNESFTVSMSGTTGGTGPFDATITFNGPVNILFNNVVLGSVELVPIEVSNGKGSVTGAPKTFIIGDKGIFNDFTKKVLTEKEFEWTLKGSVNVKTFGMNIPNLKLDKTIKIPGSNNYNTNLLDLKITENTDKTLSMEALTSITNPSPIGVEIGDMTVQLKYDQTIIATAKATGVFIGPKVTNITLSGITTLPATEQDRLNLIKVTNGFLTNTPVNTTATILSVVPKNGPVDWLNSAVQGLSLTSVVGNNPIPPKIINSIDLGEENFKFTLDDPYSPTVSSTNAVASYNMPFNINFTILQVGQKITISRDNKDIVSIESPEAPVTSTNNQLSLNISETKMQVLDKDKFSEFLVDMTTKKESKVVVYGKTDIVANTDILGQISIQGLPFNITATLQGFDQFNSDGNPPTVADLTILAGTENQLFMGIFVILTNPSKYSTSIGQVSFDMFYKDKKIGTTVIPDLSVVPGPNPVTALAILDDPAKNAKELLQLFLTGQPTTLNIKGNEQSTNITSLKPAFKAIDITSTLPPFTKPFLKSSKMVTDNQTVATNVSLGIAEISNPFVTPISIYSMNSTFSFNGNILGSVEQDLHDNPIFIPGNTVQTIQFPVKMEINPSSTFSLLRTLALQKNLDVTVLDSLIALTNVTVPGADVNAKPTPDAIRAFDLGKFVTTALAEIPVTVNIDSQVAIGNYFMPMTYKQDVIATTDESILNMIPALAKPLVSTMVDQTQMVFDSIFIQNIDVDSFDTLASGTISNVGSLPATINFPDGANIYSDNILLGKATIPSVSTDPVSGTAKFNNVSRFIIADIPTFASFSAFSYSADVIPMTITSDNVVITTFGLPIGPVSIKKTFQMSGLNGLQQFTVNKLNISPFSITIDVNNPASVGVELGKVVYDLTIENEKISTIESDSVVINPKAVSSVTFQGNLILNDPNLIQRFLSPNPPVITAQGVSVAPPKATGEVIWLTETLKSFTLTVPFSPAALLNGKNPAAPAPPAAPAA
jgi:hypothetical protein